MKKGRNIKKRKGSYFHLHGLEFLEVALCFILHVAQLFFHGCTPLSHHCLHPVCLLLLNLKLLTHRSNMVWIIWWKHIKSHQVIWWTEQRSPNLTELFDFVLGDGGLLLQSWQQPLSFLRSWVRPCYRLVNETRVSCTWSKTPYSHMWLNNIWLCARPPWHWDSSVAGRSPNSKPQLLTGSGWTDQTAAPSALPLWGKWVSSI